MATVTITLEDSPTGAVAAHSSYHPVAGQPITPAESTALEIINRTRKQWGQADTSTGMAAAKCINAGACGGCKRGGAQ